MPGDVFSGVIGALTSGDIAVKEKPKSKFRKPRSKRSPTAKPSPTVVTKTSDDVADFSKLFPAEGTTWRKASDLTIFEAIALSLNVDPDHVMHACDLPEASGAGGFGALILPDDQEAQPFYFGKDHVVFHQRAAQLHRAVHLGAIEVSKQKRQGRTLIAPQVFVVWAIGAGWHLPPWLKETVQAKRSTRQAGELGAMKRVGSATLRQEVITFACHYRANWKKVTSQPKAIDIAEAFVESLTKKGPKAFGTVPTVRHVQNVLTDTCSAWQSTLTHVERGKMIKNQPDE